MTSTQLALILGPLLAFAAVMGYLTRDDPITTKAVDQYRQSPINRALDISICIFSLIGVLLFLNNFFGAALLIISGMAFIFQNKFLGKTSLVQGIAAKVIGGIYLLIGFLLVLHHNS